MPGVAADPGRGHLCGLGMPGAAVAAGLLCEALPLDKLADALVARTAHEARPGLATLETAARTASA